jgi:hypothetical protein
MARVILTGAPKEILPPGLAPNSSTSACEVENFPGVVLLGRGSSTARAR